MIKVKVCSFSEQTLTFLSHVTIVHMRVRVNKKGNEMKVFYVQVWHGKRGQPKTWKKAYVVPASSRYDAKKIKARLEAKNLNTTIENKEEPN